MLLFLVLLSSLEHQFGVLASRLLNHVLLLVQQLAPFDFLCVRGLLNLPQKGLFFGRGTLPIRLNRLFEGLDAIGALFRWYVNLNVNSVAFTLFYVLVLAFELFFVCLIILHELLLSKNFLREFELAQDRVIPLWISISDLKNAQHTVSPHTKQVLVLG